MAKELECDISKLDDNARILEDLGINSLEFAELISEVEEKFNITVLDEDICKIRTIQDCVEILERTIDAEENGI
ncbi:MAG: acyl carrier protein [Clostridia bacterium]|nr:acyl carrier protein [Clostridia bacterium]